MTNLSVESYKNIEVFDALKEQIKTSALKAGDRLPGERKLSELYNCSRPTVRKSLRKLEQLKLVERVPGSGTYVSRRLKRKITHRNIGILVQTSKGHEVFLNDPYLLEIIAGLQSDYLNCRYKFNLLTMHIDESMDSFFERTDFSIDDFDGFICFFYTLTDEEIAVLKRKSIPFVATIPSLDNEEISYVKIDNTLGIYEAANHLLVLGRKKIKLLNGSLSYSVNQERLAGFKQALSDHDIEFDDSMNIEITPNDHKLSFEVMKDMCKSRKNDGFDGLVICGDWGTYGAFQAIKKAGLKVPEDIAIVMYDDIPWVQKILEPPITAVKQPFMEQAGRMLRILEKKFSEDTATIIEILKPQLTVRQSCGSTLLQES